ncbi:hypothetical protein [Anaerotignum sp.]|uniref:hypothetical protein n=1 Tax=Anaerotignum sp. TaxID=2039241 RepID=UPI00331B7075
MKMMWMVENWFLVVALAAVLGGIGLAIYRFTGMPTKKQVETIKEWLLYACIEAEKELGSGTGEIKLRYVYDLFIARFPSAAKMVPFALFSLWVKSAVDEMKAILSTNEKLRSLVVGDVNVKN